MIWRCTPLERLLDCHEGVSREAGGQALRFFLCVARQVLEVPFDLDISQKRRDRESMRSSRTRNSPAMIWAWSVRARPPLI